MSMNKESVI